jgi:TetR/AcrR family tetracycline transcriptional repressor
MTDRDLERLAQKRQLLNDRFERQRQRINDQFDRKEAQLSQRLNRKQEEIITVALALLDKEGLANLSLRKLAIGLDMQAPGLYWHFKNKEMLVDYLAEEILKQEFSDLQKRTKNETWQDWLSDTMNRLRKAMLSHQDGAKVVAGAHLYPAVTLGKIIELSLLSLRESGFDLMTAKHVMMSAVAYTFGSVIEEQSSPSLDEITDLLDDMKDDYPTTVEVLKLTQMSNLSDDNSYDFNAGLQLIIRGASV